MCTRTSCLALVAALIASIALPAVAQAAAPKKILVVTTTLGFRHSSIPTAEKVLGELAANTNTALVKSTGKKGKAKKGARGPLFEIDYARVEPTAAEFKGADGKPDKEKVNQAIAKVLSEKMSAEALKKYDGVIFANTTGDLPIPDRQAFLDWIKSGKSFVGMHAATDTFPGFPGYIDMIGGQFLTHGAQVEVDVQNKEPQCPMCAHLGQTWTLFDEIYLFKNFDPSKVTTVLALDKHPNNKTPGSFPISWCRQYGKGRVFYTALGHREDVWDPNTPESFERKNSKEVAQSYQAHILAGIRWTLGMGRWNVPSGAAKVE